MRISSRILRVIKSIHIIRVNSAQTEKTIYPQLICNSISIVLCAFYIAIACVLSLSGCSNGSSGNGDGTPADGPPVVAPVISWSPAVTGLPGALVRDLAVDPSNFNRMFAATDGGLYRTGDGGASWSAVTSDDAILAFDRVEIDPLTPTTIYSARSGTGVFKSTDDGLSWTAASTGLTDNTLRVLAINPTSPRTIYAGTDTTIFKTVDGALSWVALNLPVVDPEVDAIAIDVLNPATIYASTNGAGVLKSIDAGASWSVLTSGLSNPSVHSIAIDPSNPETVYAGTCGGSDLTRVFKSTDGGASWSETGLWTNYCVSALAIDPSAPTTLYAVSSFMGSPSNMGNLSKSNDGGASWESIDRGLPFSFKCSDIILNPTAPSKVYVGGEGSISGGIIRGAAQNGVYLSTDGGATWTARNDGMTNAEVVALFVNPADPRFVCAGLGSEYLGFSSSLDAGDTWGGRSFSSSIEFFDFEADPADPRITYAAGIGRYDSLFVVNGHDLSGIGADPSPINIRNFVVVMVDGNVTFFAATQNDGIFKSTDYGTSWTEINTGISNLSVTALVADPERTMILYAGTRDGVFKTTNGGASWSQMSQGLAVSIINALAIDPQNTAILYAGTDGGVYRTLDAGESWGASNDGLTALIVQAIAVDPEQPAMVYVGTPGGVFRSLDRGESWAEENDGIYVRDVRAIAIDPVTPSTIYVGTSNGGIFKAR